jgi:hypothetical protein
LKRSLDQSESVGEKMENNERDRKMMRHKIWGVQSVTDLNLSVLTEKLPIHDLKFRMEQLLLITLLHGAMPDV